MVARIETVARSIRADISLLAKMRFSTLVVSGGMPRSGSTLLFNLIRTCLEYKYPDDLVSGWIGDTRSIPEGKVYLIKSHDVNRSLAYRANTYFYSFRDVRDALLSSQRKFGQEPTIEYCRYYIKGYMAAERYAHEMFKYEEFVHDLEGAVERIQSHLCMSAPTEAILSRLPSLQPREKAAKGYDETTLMHGEHATHTKQGEWRTGLDKKLLDRIRDEYGWWLEKNEYSIY